MRVRVGCVGVIVVAAWLLPAAASAQITQGRLSGLVSDAQGAVLPGVTVTVSSPSLIGVQSTVDRKSTRLNSSHTLESRMPSSA